VTQAEEVLVVDDEDAIREVVRTLPLLLCSPEHGMVLALR